MTLTTSTTIVTLNHLVMSTVKKKEMDMTKTNKKRRPENKKTKSDGNAGTIIISLRTRTSTTTTLLIIMISTSMRKVMRRTANIKSHYQHHNLIECGPKRIVISFYKQINNNCEPLFPLNIYMEVEPKDDMDDGSTIPQSVCIF